MPRPRDDELHAAIHTFKARSPDLSLRQIAVQLHNHGFQTATGGLLSPTHIRYVLLNHSKYPNIISDKPVAIQILEGDCLETLKLLPDNSVDSVVTDPPYHLTSIQDRFGKTRSVPCMGQYARTAAGFMNKAWDSDIAFRPEVWVECMRVLKPGGHLLAFGGTRTHHRLVTAIEAAGFEIRDMLNWITAQGFPKSHNVALSIDKLKGHGARGREIAPIDDDYAAGGYTGNDIGRKMAGNKSAYQARSSEAQPYVGHGTALKPAHEPICLARKPLIGSVAKNVLAYGTGGISIDACRVPATDAVSLAANWDREFLTDIRGGRYVGGKAGGIACTSSGSSLGRFPANVLHDGSDTVLASFPNGEARFFYSAKASKQDRAGSKHPTIKPVSLMRYLCRLITPPGGIVLDPFAGSGSTGQAALEEGFSAILCEREAEYIEDIKRRLAAIA